MFEVVGQENIKNAFDNAFKLGRTAHAYLIEGPDGTGKSIFAYYMAAKMLCKGDIKPCGRCETCRKIEKNIHPDVIVIEKEKTTISINTMRRVIDAVNTKPYEGDKKIIIIKDADSITLQGQNSMLKTLEEPPADTLIIMTAKNSNLILDTIKSRCQIFKFGVVNIDKISNYLISRGIAKEKSEIAASLSGGIVGEGLKFLDQGYQSLRKDVIDMVVSITKKNEIGALEYVEFLMKNQKNIDGILDIMTGWFRDSILIKLTGNDEGVINKDYYNILLEESQVLSYNKLSGIIDIINTARERLRQYANFRLCMEVMLLDIQEV